MTEHTAPEIARRDLLKGAGAVVVSFSLPGAALLSAAEAEAAAVGRTLNPSQLDSWIAIAQNGEVTCYWGKMDMGQGVDTAIAQMVAEELDVPFDHVTVVFADTALVVNQGGASGSTGLQRSGVALRAAAAEARLVLLERAAEELNVPVDALTVTDGVVHAAGDPARSVGYGDLIGERLFDVALEWNGNYGNSLALSGRATPKSVDQYQIVGTSVPRRDLPGKIIPSTEFAQHKAVPGMLHGRMVRPPVAGAKVQSVDEDSVSDIPGAQVIVRGDLVGVVAAKEWDAIKAAEQLQVTWDTSEAGFPTTSEDLYDYIRSTTPGASEVVLDDGDVEAALSDADQVIEAEYEWPFQSHARMGPAFGLADVRSDHATVWTDSQKFFDTAHGAAKILGFPVDADRPRPPSPYVRGIWAPGPGSYGRSDAGDGGIDAVVLSQAVGAPVRVQWMRQEGHAWDPKGPASVVRVRAGLDSEGNVVGYHFHIKGFSRHDQNSRENDPSEVLAGHLIGHDSTPVWRMSEPEESYSFANKRYSWEAIAPLRRRASPLRTAHFRDPYGPEVHFASESFIDEMATAAGMDPIQFRVRYVADSRDRAVLEAAAEIAEWETRSSPNPNRGSGDVLTGRGVSYAQRNGATNAVIAEVEVNRETGRIWVKRFFVGADHGLVVNPKTLRRTIEGNLLQATSRTLFEEVEFDHKMVKSGDWSSYPILESPDVPESVEISLVHRPDLDVRGAGEPVTRVIPAAIANAVFDATGVRMRRVPFRSERVKQALDAI